MSAETQIEGYLLTAPLILVLYEHAITLSAEYDLVWRHKMTSVSIVFLLNRYTILAWSILSYLMLPAFSWKSVASCDSTLQIWFVCTMIWECIWAVFGALRVYAVSGRKWILSAVIFALGLINPVSIAFSIASNMSSRCHIHETHNPGSERIELITNRFVFAAHIGLILSDIIILTVTWSKMLKFKRAIGVESRRISSLFKVMLVDGTIYFLILLALNILQIVLWVTNTFQTLTVYMTPLFAITMSRFLLNLRTCGVSSRSQDSDGNAVDSLELMSHQGCTEDDTVFLSTFIGCMGATLHYREDSIIVGDDYA
ncbi:hypothetical protein WOLCODRAFT_139444, partial [Wolfiporia cocos MD-104 SS10]